MGDIKQYRTEPVEVDAWQWTEESEAYALEEWAGMDCQYDPHVAGGVGPDGEDWGDLTIETPAGTLTVSPFDYVIRVADDVFFPCPPGVFANAAKEITR